MVLVSGASPAGAPPAAASGALPAEQVSLVLSPPVAGARVTSQPVPGPAGAEFLLVELRVPAGARPGRYEGRLTVRRQGGMPPPGPVTGQLRLAAEVLPFDLMRPSKQYAVAQVPVSAHACRPPESVDASSLRPLKELGIGALCLDAPLGGERRTALERAIHDAGLRGPVLEPAPGAAGKQKDGETGGGQDPMQAVSPWQPESPPHDGRPAVPAADIRWYALCSESAPPTAMAALKARGARVAYRVPSAAINSAGAESVPGAVDLPIFAAEGAAGARLISRSGPLGAATAGWWRWDVGAASELESRLRAGALLWKSGLSGALLEMSPDAAARAAWPLRWEGARQGILDSRFLTTLFALMRQVKDRDQSSGLPGQAEAAVAAALKPLADTPSPAAADRFRDTVIAWILRLGRVVGA